MKYIALHGKYGEGQFTKVDDWRYEELNQHIWQLTKKGYVEWCERKDKKVIHHLMHRIVARTPKGKITDHHNHDKQDNQEHNLIVCNHSENGANRGKQANGHSGYKGVSKEDIAFIAQIWENKRRHRVGRYPTKQWAALAYDRAALEYFGQFAVTNFTHVIFESGG